MCTVVVSIGSSAAWPLLLAANRDEKLDRAWAPPAAHWPELPGVVGGRDLLAGGTWLAMNRQGVVAAVLNRTGSLGPEAGKRSRGALPLMALAYGSAGEAVAALRGIDAGEWRSFNLVIGDRRGVWVLRGLGTEKMLAEQMCDGVHMITAHDPDDESSPRVARHLPKFRAAKAPMPPDWGEWPALLADRTPPSGAAMTIAGADGFGTASSALIGLGPSGAVFRFSGSPGKAHVLGECFDEVDFRARAPGAAHHLAP